MTHVESDDYQMGDNNPENNIRYLPGYKITSRHTWGENVEIPGDGESLIKGVLKEIGAVNRAGENVSINQLELENGVGVFYIVNLDNPDAGDITFRYSINDQQPL